MINIEFQINLWKTGYELMVDGKTQLNNISRGDLYVIFREMEKYARLRFKGELSHKGGGKG
jgi:hypothetical protein